MAWNNLLNFLAGGTVGREGRETRALVARVKELQVQTPYTDDTLHDYVTSIIKEAFDRADIVPIGPLVQAFGELVEDHLTYNGFVFGLPDNVDAVDTLTAEEGVRLRNALTEKERFLRDHIRLAGIVRQTLQNIIVGIAGYLPPTCFKDEYGDPEPVEGLHDATVPLIDLFEKGPEVIERMIVTYYDEDLLAPDLFAAMREQFERRVIIASDIPLEERFTSKKKLVLPSEHRERVPSRLVDLFCDGTPWERFFQTPMPFSIPFPARFEHTHIVGGSGHGKTQLLQLAILRDLEESRHDKRSVVVIDSQGDLIRTVSHLDMLNPWGDFYNRVMLIDPNDVEFPVALNMFDFKRDGLDRLPLLERERILNGTIDLYTYFFGALLGNELTAKQGVVFRYLAQLLLEIPDATIHTFRQLMEDGEPFRPYMEKLPPTAQAFFEERFFDRSFNETKKQVLTRLWGVLSNSTFDRMFSHPRSKVDMFDAMQEGRIVLINTAKDLLKEEGASILGRFFIALIAQAALRRASLKAHERTPAFVYVDEAADYFDDRIGHLLNQARKYKVGMVLAHQNMDQLSPSLRASVLSSTSIKLVGGVSGKDSSLLASEMHTDAAFLMAQKKRRKETNFACYVRNVTPQALSISIPLGVAESQEQMPEDIWEELRKESRARYCVPLAEVPVPKAPAKKERPQREERKPAMETTRTRSEALPEEVPPPQRTRESERVAAPPPVDEVIAPKRTKLPPEPPPMGRGGKEHKYLQNLIREFAQGKGYLTTIEETILGGAGRVDVSLSLGKLKVACEISVTTGREYELANIEKCLAAGYGHVLFVSSDARHRSAMEKLAAGQVEEDDFKRLHFVAPEDALLLIAGLAGAEPTESTIRGYRVRTTKTVIDAEEAARRRNDVASVIAKSIKRPT